MKKNQNSHITRPIRTIAAGLITAAAVGLGTLVVGLSSAAATTESTVAVPASQAMTETSVVVSAGEKVTISASGSVSYDLSGDTSKPTGSKFTAKKCGAAAYGEPFSVPGVNCWSMVFRVGPSGPAFPTGNKITFTSPASGHLFLGFNDGNYEDNSGSFTAKITTP